MLVLTIGLSSSSTDYILSFDGFHQSTVQIYSIAMVSFRAAAAAILLAGATSA